MGSKRKASNVSIKFFRKVGYNKSFFSSNKPRGDVSVIALERAFLEKNIMESFRRVITRGLNRLGKINIPLTFNTPFSAKPSGIRMGKGKGKISKHIARVSSGTVLLEIHTYNRPAAAKALLKALHKLPIKTEIRLRTFFFND
jgi:large subunit ribosomal protein L16